MRRDFQRLAELRAEEARILVRNRKQQGAYYLAGYAVECGLKACIAKQTRKHEFPPDRDYAREIYTHNLSKLLQQAGLEMQLQNEMKASPTLANNWNVGRLGVKTRDTRFQASRGMTCMGPLLGRMEY